MGLRMVKEDISQILEYMKGSLKMENLMERGLLLMLIKENTRDNGKME
jgi:hypothetical protein